MNIRRSKCWVIAILLFFHTPLLLGKELFTPRVVEQAKRSIVTIQANASFSAYDRAGQWIGTGCIVDKQSGYILTNRHVIGAAVVGSYKVTFFNGIQKEANLVYYDQWLDYGFLQMAPEAIPQAVTETSFSVHNPVIDQPIFMVGNNEGYSFSLHTGVVADLYDVMNIMPQQSIKLSLNTKGGSSGSPIFNQQGQAVALNYAANNTFGYALHPEYIRYALAAIRQSKSPIRKQIGVITKSAVIGDLVRYNGLPTSVQQAYIKAFPSGATAVIQVDHLLANSPAAGLLLPGDLIWAIDGQQIGPNLVALDMAMNKATKDHVRLTIFRGGAWHDIEVGLYNLDAHKITKMVHFGGAIFFEMDHMWAKLNGIPAKSLTFVNTDANHIFNHVAPDRIREGFRVKILALNEKPVVSLQALIEAIPSLIDKKYFTIDYVDCSPYRIFGEMHVGARLSKEHVEYGAHIPQPRLFIWDEAAHQWYDKPIG